MIKKTLIDSEHTNLVVELRFKCCGTGKNQHDKYVCRGISDEQGLSTE